MSINVSRIYLLGIRHHEKKNNKNEDTYFMAHLVLTSSQGVWPYPINAWITIKYGYLESIIQKELLGSPEGFLFLTRAALVLDRHLAAFLCRLRHEFIDTRAI